MPPPAPELASGSPLALPGGGQVLDPITRTWNSCVNATRASVEHGIAHLKTCWRALARVTLCPWHVPAIIAVILVLSVLKNRYRQRLTRRRIARQPRYIDPRMFTTILRRPPAPRVVFVSAQVSG